VHNDFVACRSEIWLFRRLLFLRQTGSRLPILEMCKIRFWQFRDCGGHNFHMDRHKNRPPKRPAASSVTDADRLQRAKQYRPIVGPVIIKDNRSVIVRCRWAAAICCASRDRYTRSPDELTTTLNGLRSVWAINYEQLVQ